MLDTHGEVNFNWMRETKLVYGRRGWKNRGGRAEEWGESTANVELDSYILTGRIPVIKTK